jgi:hypothetical protein
MKGIVSADKLHSEDAGERGAKISEKSNIGSTRPPSIRSMIK